MTGPGQPVHIETLDKPDRYAFHQIQLACSIAEFMNRGKLVLVEPPAKQ